ncbi:MAG: hypothetical protein KDK91_30000, partial [Gammaproteobacteria bacterium]|nr:hypothetical protein [Gammaproteobacteria bacterium]
MKTQISRISFRARQRYSGVYQQQGRMIVDADLNEQTDITRTRLDAALEDVIGTGIPASGGLDIRSDGAGGIEIVPGRVYVDGIAAEVIAAEGASTVPYSQQEDFPDPPPVPAGELSPPASPPEGGAYTVYLDVWERPVLALEDPSLIDPGLHGADTCSRTRTMAQVKWCPAGQNPEDTTFNPRIGDALLSLAVRDATTVADPCDPCAEVVDLDTLTGNYLFRLEVHDLGRDAGGNYTLTLKWSSENGAEQYRVDNLPSDFSAGDWVYEFYDDRCEKHLGWHLAGAAGFPERGLLRTELDAAPGAAAYPYVRRWDGYCVLVRNGGVWVLATDAAGAGVGVDRGVPLSQTSEPISRLGEVNVGDDLLINLDRLRLTLSLRVDGFERRFVPGDYWLAAVREQHASGTVLLERARPHGIEHHYMLLADVDGNLVSRADSASCGRYAFPPLTNITAAGVCFDNTCPDLFGADTNNLQDALTHLCNELDAADVAYLEPECPANAPAPSLRALLESKLGPGWPDVDDDGLSTVKDVLDALLCHLDAARLPFDPAPLQARWQAIVDAGTLPTTAQQAIDTLARDLDADDIALDKSDTSLCAALQANEVVSVQDALNTLCRSSAGGCAHTVGEGGSFATLDQAFQALAGERFIALCLLAGEHLLSAPVDDLALSTLKLTGGGSNATRIRLRGDYVLRADELIMTDLTVIAAPNRSVVIEAQRASVHACRFERIGSAAGAAPMVMVRGAAGAELAWRENELLAIARP